MSEIKVNSIKGVGASAAAITVNNTDGTCTANITNNLSNRNLIINGAMQVAQRGTSSTSTGIQTCDRWHLAYGGTDEAPTQAQVDLSSSDTPYSSGFRKSYKITNGNQTSGAGASDFISFLTPLEAQDLANSGWNYTDSNSKLTIQFWAKSSVAKTFCVQLYTVDGTSQAYNHHYALAANTWTKITHTFPGYASVQFDNDNNKGIEIQWNMFAGTTYTSGSTVDQWVTYSGTTSTPDDTSDWYTTNDATFEITGVQLEVGSVATDFEHRSFAQELALCQRYFYKTYDYATAPATATFVGMQHGRNFDTGSARSAVPICLNFPVRMRAVPTLTWYAGDGQSGKYSTGSTVGGTNLTTEKSVGTDIDESETGIYHANFSEDVPATNLYAYHVVAVAEL